MSDLERVWLALVTEAAPHASPGGNKRRMGLFRCVCGTEKIIRISHVKSGRTKSCGCKKLEISAKKNKTHGMRKSPEYAAWCHMKQRCDNPNDNRYPSYGARGIKVCARWQTFDNFLEDMGKRPSSKHSLDRIDNDGDYEPCNCRWATVTVQAGNKSTNRIITAFGKTLTLAQWGRETGINRATIAYRLKKGWDPEVALSKEVSGVS